MGHKEHHNNADTLLKNLSKEGGTETHSSGFHSFAHYSLKSCTHPGKPIKIGGYDVWLAARRDIDNTVLVKDKIDLIIPLNGDLPNLKDGSIIQVMYLELKDFGGVPYNWKELVESIATLIKDGTNILFYCTGGHGRTGCLGASLIAVMEPHIEDPIDEIRKRYCKHAVESMAQKEAIFALKGMKLPEKYLHMPLSASTGTAQWHDIHNRKDFPVGSLVKVIETANKGGYGKVVRFVIMEEQAWIVVKHEDPKLMDKEFRYLFSQIKLVDDKGEDKKNDISRTNRDDRSLLELGLKVGDKVRHSLMQRTGTIEKITPNMEDIDRSWVHVKWENFESYSIMAYVLEKIDDDTKIRSYTELKAEFPINTPVICYPHTEKEFSGFVVGRFVTGTEYSLVVNKGKSTEDVSAEFIEEVPVECVMKAVEL